MAFFDKAAKEDVLLLQDKIHNSFKKYESEKYMGYKSYKFEITNEGFIRYKKVFVNNKSEFYSVKVNRLSEIKYQGTETNGWFLISCEPSSVIFQTYQDPSGNLDSMINEIVFPVNNISVEELNELKYNFESLKKYFK